MVYILAFQEPLALPILLTVSVPESADVTKKITHKLCDVPPFSKSAVKST